MEPACYKAPVSTKLPAQVDVAILGAGFAGCATAWALAARGVGALVLERESELGVYASGRGAGLGRQLAEDDATTALTVRGAALLRDQLGAAWSPTGGILGFDDATVAAAYAARAARLRVACEPLDRAAVLARWPQLDGLPLAVALLVPSDGVIDTRGLLHAFARDAAVALAAPAVHVDHDGHRAQIETPRGTVRAKVVVDATGAWAGALVGERPLDVFKRHLFVLEAPRPLAAATPYLWHLGARELYVRRAADGILVSPCDGERVAPAAEQPGPDADAQLRARLAEGAPQLARAAIVRRWACQRAFAPDRRMRLGRDQVRPWLVHAAALGGHGATAAPAVGETVAAAVLDALRGWTG